MFGKKKIKNLDRLIKGIKSGDEKSFEELYNLEFEKIYRFVSMKVGARTEAEEIVQDVFFRLWKYSREGNEVTNLRGLLYRISRTRIMDYYRAHGREPQQISLDGQDGYDGNFEALQLADERDIEKILDIKYDLEKVKKEMSELAEDDRDALMMRFISEMSHKEIAEAMGKSEVAVRVMIHRALKIIKEHLNSHNDNDANFT